MIDHPRELVSKIHNLLYTNSSASRPEVIAQFLIRLATSILDGNQKNLDFSTFEKSIIFRLSKDDQKLWNSIHQSIQEDIFRSLNTLCTIRSQDITSDIYQTIVGRTLRGDLGQFFTPPTAIDAIFSVYNPPKKGTVKVVDPAFGTGGFGFGLYRAYSSWSSCKLEFTGIDKDQKMFEFTSNTMATLSRIKSHCFNADSLDITNNLKSKNYSLNSFDLAVTNPPFGSKIHVVNQDILSQYDLGHIWEKGSNQNWIRTDKILDQQEPQILFIELLIKLLKPGGTFAIVLPEGLFGNSKSSYIWTWLESNIEISHLIDCPRTMFQPCTDVKSNILVGKKLAKNEKQKPTSKVWIGIVKNCGHDKRGRSIYSDEGLLINDFSTFTSHVQKNQENEHFFTVPKNRLNSQFMVPRSYAGQVFDHLKNTKDIEYVKFGDLIKKGLISVRKGIEPGAKEYGQGDVPFIRTSDIINGEISTATNQTVSEDCLKSFQNKISLAEGDIFLVADGRYRIGQMALVTSLNLNSVVQSHVKIVKCLKPDKLHPYVLFYVLRSSFVQDQFYDYTFIQSTIGTVGKRINNIVIPLPKQNNSIENIIQTVDDTMMKRAKLLDDWKNFESLSMKDVFGSKGLKKNYPTRSRMPDIQL